jgi:A118 family predicted phage portal protein
MRLSDSIVSLWLLLFGSKLDKSVVEGDKLIQVWNDIYAGRPEWQKYTTTGIGGKRTEYRYLMNAAKMLCSELSGLVFAEPPAITADKSVMDILAANKFLANLRPWAEIAIALGGGALKWTVKDGKFVIDYVHATDIIPVSYDSTGISEADFLSTEVVNAKEYKIVESHRKTATGYRIEVKAYQKISEAEYRLVPNPEGIGGDAEIATTRPLFSVFKYPAANNIDMYSPLGLSIFANAMDSARQLDEAFDYVSDEMETSRRKIILPQSMIQTYFDNSTRKSSQFYDKNERVYVAFNSDEIKDMTPVSINFQLRITEIAQTINTLLSIFCRQCGVDDGFLSFDGKSMKTATEVISENSKTFRTKKNIENALGATIIDFLSVLKDIGGLYGVSTTSADYTIDWDDSVIEDRNARATYHETLYASGLEDRVTAIMGIHGLDEEKANEMAAKIKSDKAVVADPFGMGA